MFFFGLITGVSPALTNTIQLKLQMPNITSTRQLMNFPFLALQIQLAVLPFTTLHIYDIKLMYKCTKPIITYIYKLGTHCIPKQNCM